VIIRVWFGCTTVRSYRTVICGLPTVWSTVAGCCKCQTTVSTVFDLSTAQSATTTTRVSRLNNVARSYADDYFDWLRRSSLHFIGILDGRRWLTIGRKKVCNMKKLTIYFANPEKVCVEKKLFWTTFKMEIFLQRRAQAITPSDTTCACVTENYCNYLAIDVRFKHLYWATI